MIRRLMLTVALLVGASAALAQQQTRFLVTFNGAQPVTQSGTWNISFGGTAQPVTQSGAWSISFTAPQHVICDSGCVGGGGGGAVTVADGADVAQGTTTDVAVQGDNAGTISAKLRGLNKSIAAGLAVTGTFFQVTQPVSATALPLPTNAAAETGGNLATLAAVVDTVGTAAPATALVVAAVDPNGLTQTIKTTGAGVLLVESSGGSSALIALRLPCNALRKTNCR